MTISSLIKRLQDLEYKHGGQFKVITLQDSDDQLFAEEELVAGVTTHEGAQVCAIMSQMHWEKIAPKGLDYESV